MNRNGSPKSELWKKEGYAQSWVFKPVMEILAGLSKSMLEYPNIKPGQDFTGYHRRGTWREHTFPG
jgi:hypothetical protein